MREKKARLQLLTGLAQERRDAAGKRLGQSLERHGAALKRLALLERYFDEYRHRLVQASAAGISAGELRNFEGFLQRMEDAIEQQRAEVSAAARATDESRGRFLAERRRTRSFDTLAGRVAEMEREREARELQKLIDEFAQRHG